jgi:hypothetical protein
MGVGLGVNDVPIVGQPIAYGGGFLALLFVSFSTYIGWYFYFYSAAGGQLLVLGGLARPIDGFGIYDKRPVSGTLVRGEFGWAVDVLLRIAGGFAPPLLGLAGAALIASGNPWAVLAAAIFLSILALLVARNALAFTIPLLVVLGLGAALLYGSGEQQAFAATFVVWFLLIAGTVWAFRYKSVLWRLLFIFVAVVALIVGAQLLLRPGYGIG